MTRNFGFLRFFLLRSLLRRRNGDTWDVDAGRREAAAKAMGTTN